MFAVTLTATATSITVHKHKAVLLDTTVTDVFSGFSDVFSESIENKLNSTQIQRKKVPKILYNNNNNKVTYKQRSLKKTQMCCRHMSFSAVEQVCLQVSSKSCRRQ